MMHDDDDDDDDDDVHLRLIGKPIVDFLLVIELFFARCFRFVTIHAFDRQTDRQTDRCR